MSILLVVVYMLGGLSGVRLFSDMVQGMYRERLRLKTRLLERQWAVEDRQALEGSVSLLLTNRELAVSLRDKITVALREEAKQLPPALSLFAASPRLLPAAPLSPVAPDLEPAPRSRRKKRQ